MIGASEIVFWTNLKLAQKAGIEPAKIKTWDDFLAAVQKGKAAGIVPIVAGGKDKWPLHFYYGYLALREAGAAGFRAAMKGEGDGFAARPFIKAGEDLSFFPERHLTVTKLCRICDKVSVSESGIKTN